MKNSKKGKAQKNNTTFLICSVCSELADLKRPHYAFSMAGNTKYICEACYAKYKGVYPAKYFTKIMPTASRGKRGCHA